MCPTTLMTWGGKGLTILAGDHRSFHLGGVPLGLLLLALNSCSPEYTQEGPATLDDAFIWEREISLEENEDVINLVPHFSMDASGGFLVADESEHQLRRYDQAGNLLATYGREGEGPGEFTQPVRVVQLPGGDILGIDWNGRYGRFRPGGDLVAADAAPVWGITDLAVLGEEEVLIAGNHHDSGVEGQLHVLDLTSNRVLRSFFQPPPREFTSPLTVAVHPDRFSVLYGLSDTLYVFDRAGTIVAKHSIPGVHFQPYRDPEEWPPPPKWFESFTFAYDITRLPDETVLVQYYRIQTGAEPVYGLLHMDLDGNPFFELLNTPKLVAGDRNGSRVAFLSPGTETPNRLRVGGLRFR